MCLGSGDKFYTEAELIKMFNVSSITVVRALNELAADGYIVRQQGKGTFVSRARKHKLVEFSDVETFPIQKDKVSVRMFCNKFNCFFNMLSQNIEHNSRVMKFYFREWLS